MDLEVLMEVICYIAMMTHSGVREVVEARGIEVKERNDDMYVDFTTYLKNNPRFVYDTLVQKINGNDCLYVEKK
jgi:hypothetical protein